MIVFICNSCCLVFLIRYRCEGKKLFDSLQAPNNCIYFPSISKCFVTSRITYHRSVFIRYTLQSFILYRSQFAYLIPIIYLLLLVPTTYSSQALTLGILGIDTLQNIMSIDIENRFNYILIDILK